MQRHFNQSALIAIATSVLPNIERYVVVDSRRIAALLLSRTSAGIWRETPLESSDAVLDLYKICVRVALGAFYPDAEF